nr:hypothetical protein BaRGS_008137 [Batillaria attramentaria]
MASMGKAEVVQSDKSLSKGKPEVNAATYALLFSEIVQYCQNRVYTVPELQKQPAKVTVHWHKGTCFMIKFDESVIARDKMIDSR